MTRAATHLLEAPSRRARSSSASGSDGHRVHPARRPAAIAIGRIPQWVVDERAGVSRTCRTRRRPASSAQAGAGRRRRRPPGRGGVVVDERCTGPARRGRLVADRVWCSRRRSLRRPRWSRSRTPPTCPTRAVSCSTGRGRRSSVRTTSPGGADGVLGVPERACRRGGGLLPRRSARLDRRLRTRRPAAAPVSSSRPWRTRPCTRPGTVLDDAEQTPAGGAARGRGGLPPGGRHDPRADRRVRRSAPREPADGALRVRRHAGVGRRRSGPAARGRLRPLRLRPGRAGRGAHGLGDGARRDAVPRSRSRRTPSSPRSTRTPTSARASTVTRRRWASTARRTRPRVAEVASMSAAQRQRLRLSWEWWDGTVLPMAPADETLAGAAALLARDEVGPARSLRRGRGRRGGGRGGTRPRRGDGRGPQRSAAGPGPGLGDGLRTPVT